jgi:hypothetical protein
LRVGRTGRTDAAVAAFVVAAACSSLSNWIRVASATGSDPLPEPMSEPVSLLHAPTAPTESIDKIHDSFKSRPAFIVFS